MTTTTNTHATFRIHDTDELRKMISEMALDIPVTDDISVLCQPVDIAGKTVPNRMAIHPMEGCDGKADGSPDELTFRRYRRFGAGGAGLLWFEACAVVPEGRANPRQIWLREENKAEFARLVSESKKAAHDSMGASHEPFMVLQLTHSGRYSRPVDLPKPIIAHRDPLLDKDKGLPPDYPLITDDELDRLEEMYVKAAKLAFEVGFDAVDIKSCHRYLMNEILASHTREGKYGGSYENRTRLLKNTVKHIKDELGKDKIVTARLGIHDAHPYPHGWGMDSKHVMEPNLEEPKRLLDELHGLGFPIINITMGNPYFNPHVNRPYDKPIIGFTEPDEHPLYGCNRLFGLTKEVQKHLPELPMIGSGYSWLRNLWPYVAAANIKDGNVSFVGLGRQAYAYPAFAREIIETGRLERRHTCITCSSCTQIMRDGGKSGCVPFDSEVYGPIFREGRRNAPDYIKMEAERCRDCFDPTCRDGCPAGVDIPGFVKALAEGDIAKSYAILQENNVLPEVCAYVCPAEEQCQAKCVEAIFSENPISIRELQKYVTQKARQMGIAKLPDIQAPTGKKVAVIGAGPAGIACAATLVTAGHEVHIFDTSESIGGVAAAAIPARRLQNEAVKNEFEAVFERGKDRLHLHPGEGLEANRTLDYFTDNFDAVFVGVGLAKGIPLSDNRPHGVMDAIDFLKKAKREGVTVPEKVAVIGGGNTAMDAATTAIEQGALDAYIIYRRSYREMPAWDADKQEALDMGAHFIMLTQPVGYEMDENGNLCGVRVARTQLGAPDESGRRRPEIVPDSEAVIEVGMVLEAIGQAVPEELVGLLAGVEINRNGLIVTDESAATTVKKVFAGGDVVNGGTTAVQAIAEGMKAAGSIDSYLKG